MNNNEPYIVGIGPGDKGFLYPLATAAIEKADVLIGGKRNLEEFAHLRKKTISIDRSLQPIVEYIDNNWQQEKIAVLASGDTGLFSINTYLRKKLPSVPFQVLPGISSLQYLMAQENLSWNELKIVSLHGNDKVNIINTVATNPVTAIFTGNGNAPASIAGKLKALNYADLDITVGENLSYPEERIIKGSPQEISDLEFGPLNIMIVKNNDYYKRPWPYLTAGLPDDIFIRDEVPMTKSEVRTLIMSKLKLKADSRILEIGAGTGSCTIEIGLLANEGKVFALERNPQATELCKKNISKFALDNITLIEGTAPQDIPDDLVYDRVFIGGSGGNMHDIIRKISDKKLRLVVSAITVESVSEAIDAMEEMGFDNIEIVQAAISRSRKAGGKHLMLAINPITIISGDLL